MDSISTQFMDAGVLARAAGKTLGRPRVGAAIETKVRALLLQKKGKIAIAKAVGCGVGTVQRIAAAMAVPA